MEFEFSKVLERILEKYNEVKGIYEDVMNLRGEDLKLPDNVAMPLARNHRVDRSRHPYDISVHFRKGDYEHHENIHIRKYVAAHIEYVKAFMEYRKYTFYLKIILDIKMYIDTNSEDLLYDNFHFGPENDYCSMYHMFRDADIIIQLPAREPYIQRDNLNYDEIMQLYSKQQKLDNEFYSNIFHTLIEKIRVYNFNWDSLHFDTVTFNENYDYVMRMV